MATENNKTEHNQPIKQRKKRFIQIILGVKSIAFLTLHIVLFSRSRLCGLIVRMRVVPRRTVVGDIDRRFDNLRGSHHQSHMNCVSSVYGIYVSGELSREFYNYCTSQVAT